jgi:glutaconate CoA-transferase subunit B
LVTNLCVFAFDRNRRRFRLASVHPGRTVDEVRANTGFAFDAADSVPATAPPDAESLALIRNSVGREIAEVYPLFASRLRRSQGAG